MHDNDIYVIARLLRKKPWNNSVDLVQSCKLAEEFYLVIVNVIHSAWFLVVPDIGLVDIKIVFYIIFSNFGWQLPVQKDTNIYI